MEPILINNVRVVNPFNQTDMVRNLLISSDGLKFQNADECSSSVKNGAGMIALPGLTDLHVHFRQPGFEYKETIATGCNAAFAGGVTSVVVMPNTSPTLDSAQRVHEQIELAKKFKGVRLQVAAAVTQGLQGEIANDYKALKDAGAVAITDDGRPVMSDSIMAKAMRACVENDLLFMQHAEDLSLSKGGSMNEGNFSRQMGVQGQLAEAEGVMVERDIRLAKKFGARYHVLHVSTKRSLDAVREAKMAGLKVSCEVTPHHLMLTDEACLTFDTNKKMNPPLRSDTDRVALIEALIDGTIDAVASDHAPHSQEEKNQHFCEAPFGVVGLETAFAVLLTLVNKNIISLKKAIALMTTGPAKVLKSEASMGSLFSVDNPQDLCLIDVNKKWNVNDSMFHGQSKNSAFLGLEFQGKVMATFLAGKLKYSDLEW